MGNTLHHGIQDVLYAFAGLTRSTDDITAITTYEVDDFIFHLVGHGRWHVYLIDDRDNLQIVIDRHIEVRDSLRLHTLRGIDHEQRTLTSRNRTAHFV